MTEDIKLKERVSPLEDKPTFAIELVFKRSDIGQKLSSEERQLLQSCIGEILGEIEIEEKRIIEEERKTALEVTARSFNTKEHKMPIKLSSAWAPFFKSNPETGMGYTICTAVLNDERRFERVVVDSGYITSVDGNAQIPFEEVEISDFVITHDKTMHPVKGGQ
jgi:hypothetical protein